MVGEFDRKLGVCGRLGALLGRTSCWKLVQKYQSKVKVNVNGRGRCREQSKSENEGNNDGFGVDGRGEGKKMAAHDCPIVDLRFYAVWKHHLMV